MTAGLSPLGNSKIPGELTGTILGYDPGGDGKHGVAFATCEKGVVTGCELTTLRTAEQVIAATADYTDLIAVGIDTLTCWSTGPSGWRPADRWLKKRYKPITHSIASANSLFGSMGLNGMAVLLALRACNPALVVCETHPKVLHFALQGAKYDYRNNRPEMDKFLSQAISQPINTSNDHEWDAAISVYAVMQGMAGRWSHDLHAIAPDPGEQIIEPCDTTYYWWPE